MKVAELEAHHDALADSERAISTMVADCDFPRVFDVCIGSFPHVVPAINYRKKKGITPEITDFLAFSIICKYAPPLFECAAIESLYEFVNSSRVLIQAENNFLASIEAARKREQLAYRLWNYLERNVGTLQCDIHRQLRAVQEDAVEVVELWEQLGIVQRQPEDGSYQLFFRTHLDSEMMGVCPNCGVRAKGRKELFFRAVTCKKCGTEGHYHIEYR